MPINARPEEKGTVCLIWPPAGDRRPWLQFWRGHRKLLGVAQTLILEAPTIGDFCRRLAIYVSADLYWVDSAGAAPIVFSAVAAGLQSCDTVRQAQFAEELFVTCPRNTLGAFVDATMAHAARKLSFVRVSSHDAVWLPAAGKPLVPWLETQTGVISASTRTFDQEHEKRVRSQLEAYVLNSAELQLLSEEPESWGPSK